MEHPCSKECLKYPICISKKSIRCHSLEIYFKQLMEECGCGSILLIITRANKDHVWGSLNYKLPHLEKMHVSGFTINKSSNQIGMRI